jgi:hypothetical protein
MTSCCGTPISGCDGSITKIISRRIASEAAPKADNKSLDRETLTSRVFGNVQKGDKFLYRARFTGFDIGTAEAACQHLKRSDMGCIALKN